MAVSDNLDETRKAATSLKDGIKWVPHVGAVGIAKVDGGYAIRVNVDSVQGMNNAPPMWHGIDIEFALVEDIQPQ